MTPDQIYAELKRLAPSIAFTTELSHDREYVWDGDGPDPAEEGYRAYNVKVIATVIHQGNTLTAADHLGGHYQKPGEPDHDIGGYLPQMLQQAADDLAQVIRDDEPKRAELRAADRFLGKIVRARYNAQRAASN